jgi:hypothetical protein
MSAGAEAEGPDGAVVEKRLERHPMLGLVVVEWVRLDAIGILGSNVKFVPPSQVAPTR